MYTFVQTTVDDVSLTEVKSLVEKPKNQSFTFAHPIYNQMGVFHGAFYEAVVDYIQLGR